MSVNLISLVSEQSIPNLQFIKEFEDRVDRFIFISTRKMEPVGASRTEWIIQAAGIQERPIERLITDPHSISQVVQMLSNIGLSEEDEYLVNITCGTKLMAIAAFGFFGSYPKARIYYSFIEENSYRQVHPHINHAEKEFTHELSMKEYMTSYGLEISFAGHDLTDNRVSHELMEECFEHNNNVNHIPRIKDSRHYRSPKDKSFYSGGWFEEYVYYRIKKELKLSEQQIAMKVRIQKNDIYNELDVVFIHRNTIHVVECKAYFGTSKLKAKVESALYKLGAIDDKFGIRAKSVFISNLNLHGKLSHENTVFTARAKDLGVGFLQMDDLKKRRLCL